MWSQYGGVGHEKEPTDGKEDVLDLAGDCMWRAKKREEPKSIRLSSLDAGEDTALRRRR